MHSAIKRKIVQIRDTSDQYASCSDRTSISIFHDNPQLSKTIGEKEGMEVIVESALSKTSVRILFGKVLYSGAYEPSFYGVDASNMRGADIIILEILELISADLGKFPFRMDDGIKILQLRGADVPGVERRTDSISIQDVENFFSPCTGRVDVILDPIQHDNYSYYPYYEGTRKLAPQFRSHGVGYIRLGDDMSNFGTAFISLDSGKTFLDHGANDKNVMSSMNTRRKSRSFALTTLTTAAEATSTSTKVDVPTREQIQSAKKVRIQAISSQPELSKSMPEMKLTSSGVLTRSAARRAAQEAAVATMVPTISADLALPVSSRKRNRASIEPQSPEGTVASTSTAAAVVSFVSPEPSAKKPKLAESLRRSVRASRSKLSYSGNNDGSSLPTPRKLNMNAVAMISNTIELEQSVNSTLDSLQQIDLSGSGSAAWKTKVELVKRFQQDLEQISCEEYGNSVSSMVIVRLFEVIKEQIVKTSNPMYTVTIIELVPIIASIFSSHISSVSTEESTTLPLWQNIVTECFHQLRNSNRQIEMAATRVMTTMTQQSYVTWNVLISVAETWLGIVPGSTAPKTLVKLNKVLEFFEQRVLIDGKNAGSALFQPPEDSPQTLARIVRISVVGTKDRDEKNRSAGIQLIATVAVADICTHRLRQSYQEAPTVAEVSSLLSSNGPAWLIEELAKSSINIQKIIGLVDKVVPRLF